MNDHCNPLYNTADISLEIQKSKGVWNVFRLKKKQLYNSTTLT